MEESSGKQRYVKGAIYTWRTSLKGHYTYITKISFILVNIMAQMLLNYSLFFYFVIFDFRF